MNTRDFTELLKGCRPVKDSDGNIVVQSIMGMQIVCLTTDPEFSLDTRFANPLKALQASNSSYGQITFDNRENLEVIIPTQMAILTKQSAQNHSMTKAGYMRAHSQTTFHDAGCVQGSQTGHFRGTQEFRMLPVTMREMVLNTVGKPSSYDRIYSAVNKLGVDTQSNAGNYLNIYFDKYDKKLEQFIAHFERPKNLIGIVVLVDGEIVAIDKFPSFTYAEQVWEMMIRDCYGSLAIISELKKKSTNHAFTENFNEMKKNSQDSIVDLIEKALNKTKKDMTNSVQEKISELLETSFDATSDNEGYSYNSSSAPKSWILRNDGYIGQVITENEFNHLVSIVKREAFNPNALREVNELRRKARRQDKFTL